MSRQRTGLATRLMVAQLIVIAVGGLTLLVTEVIVAPPLFTEHLRRSGVTDPGTIDHAERAFNSAYLISLAVASATAIAAASVISWLLVKRVVPPLQRLSDATRQVAAGNYDTPIPEQGFGAELDSLTASFRQLAWQLKEVDESRTQMLNDLAHEIGTPLGTLEAFIDGLEDGIVEADPETYQVLRNQISRLHRLTRDIRQAASRREQDLDLDMRLALLDVRSQLQLAAELATPEYRSKGVSLSARVDSLTRSVMADEERIQQVLTNVLSNALQHTAPGGSVILEARNHGGNVQITVTDDGDGIAADELEAIFDRFHRVDPARTIAGSPTGSGLGLTIARRILIEHQGTITAESPGLGQGSTFTIELPAHQ